MSKRLKINEDTSTLCLRTSNVPSRRRIVIYIFRFGKAEFRVPPLTQSDVDRSHIVPSFLLQPPIMVSSFLGDHYDILMKKGNPYHFFTRYAMKESVHIHIHIHTPRSLAQNQNF